MSYRHLLLDLDRTRHVATLTLNKPERLNAIDQTDKVDLLDAIAKIQADDDIWVAIWTGAGRGFCSGADLQGPPPDDGDKPLNELLDEDSWISRQGKALYAVDKPMIAAVNGVAAGAGFSLALACDIRVGCPDTRFVTVFQERSLPPEGGMSFLLSRVVGFSRAMDLALTSRRVEADEAYRIGLIDRLVPNDQLLATANALADRICQLPPAAVRVSKRAIQLGAESSFAEASANETRYGGLARRARKDAEESARAFAERRKPTYTGR
ncbi:MAG TPA: enoyl-CoA hydratase-related protein [Pseudomonadales bacterium]|nr:enoyl-CoA hydratase-related protein [Pseudomonadales bacterium]